MHTGVHDDDCMLTTRARDTQIVVGVLPPDYYHTTTTICINNRGIISAAAAAAATAATTTTETIPTTLRPQRSLTPQQQQQQQHTRTQTHARDSTAHTILCAVLSLPVCVYVYMVCVCMYRRESHTLFLAYAQPTNRYSHACGAHPIERAHTDTRRTMKQTTNQRTRRDWINTRLHCCPLSGMCVCVCVRASPRRPLCLLSSSCVIIIVIVVDNNNNNNSNNDDDNSNKGGAGDNTTQQQQQQPQRGSCPWWERGPNRGRKIVVPNGSGLPFWAYSFFFSRPGPVPLYILSDGPASLGARKVLRPVCGLPGFFRPPAGRPRHLAEQSP